jgi:hypothetical protein
VGRPPKGIARRYPTDRPSGTPKPGRPTSECRHRGWASGSRPPAQITRSLDTDAVGGWPGSGAHGRCAPEGSVPAPLAFLPRSGGRPCPGPPSLRAPPSPRRPSAIRSTPRRGRNSRARRNPLTIDARAPLGACGRLRASTRRQVAADLPRTESDQVSALWAVAPSAVARSAVARSAGVPARTTGSLPVRGRLGATEPPPARPRCDWAVRHDPGAVDGRESGPGPPCPTPERPVPATVRATVRSCRGNEGPISPGHGARPSALGRPQGDPTSGRRSDAVGRSDSVGGGPGHGDRPYPRGRSPQLGAALSTVVPLAPPRNRRMGWRRSSPRRPARRDSGRRPLTAPASIPAPGELHPGVAS